MRRIKEENEREARLIDLWRKLNEQQREKVMRVIAAYAKAAK